MTTGFVQTVSEYLPLRINEVNYADPILTLSGAGWSVSIVCPWRLVKEGEVVASLGSDDAETHVGDLVDHEIVGVASADDLRDPVFNVSGGLTLEVFADTDLDPWVLRLPSHTFVGTASES